jgi:hypothetical protein
MGCARDCQVSADEVHALAAAAGLPSLAPESHGALRSVETRQHMYSGVGDGGRGRVRQGCTGAYAWLVTCVTWSLGRCACGRWQRQAPA